jgi:NAD(P)-dependent dehydrogenase (short-subunit alcohol dehydrogenase family)
MAILKKNILVIGASKGIGLQVANYLSLNGYKVFALARSRKNKKMIEGINYLEFDVTSNDYRTLHEFFRGIRFDGLVFCVGATFPVGTHTEIVRFEKTLRVNLISPFNFICEIKSQLKKESSIVFLSSINAKQGFTKNPGYVASKSGLEGLTRALAIDLSLDGIRVNSLALGYFPTDMTSRSFMNRSKRNLRSKRTILGRWGRLSEIPPVVDFLLSDNSSYITGESISVDGGWLAKGI